MWRELTATLICVGSVSAQDSVAVASKNFTESRLLAEISAQLVEARTDLVVERRFDLGGTQLCWGALRDGAIDWYCEYTGTAWAVVLKETDRVTDPLQTYLRVQARSRAEQGVVWLQPFGFENTYAIAMAEAAAERLGIVRISDLTEHAPTLEAGFSVEFMNREDGFPGLVTAYGLDFEQARGLEHGLAYAAVAAAQIDVIDAYSTDAKLRRYRLRVLEDDRRYFPPYHAAPVVRAATLQAHPELGDALNRLAFRLSAAEMQLLNYQVEEEGLAFADVARGFLEREGLLGDVAASATAEPRADTFLGLMAQRSGETLRLTLEHLWLTLLAVALASVVAIPLGIVITCRPRLRQIALGTAGIVQTIPSLALLALMIPFLGLDMKAAIAALFVYAILPILRNTYTGISTVDADLIEAARGMGMRDRQILWRVQLPLATPTIMAGIRTSTVISVGVATLAAFISAGGLGEPIVAGLYLADTNLILSGAVPAALLAILVDLGLGRLEGALAPRMRGGT